MCVLSSLRISLYLVWFQEVKEKGTNEKVTQTGHICKGKGRRGKTLHYKDTHTQDFPRYLPISIPLVKANQSYAQMPEL